MNRIIPVLILVVTYLALTPKIDFPQVLCGLVIALVITGLLRPTRRPVHWKKLPSTFWAAGVYLTDLIRDVIHSGMVVTRIVLDPKLPLKPGIIAFPPECASEYGRALAAYTISLAPGELLIEMDEDGTMYIHTLDVQTSERMVGASQKRRQNLLRKVFDGYDDGPVRFP